MTTVVLLPPFPHDELLFEHTFYGDHDALLSITLARATLTSSIVQKDQWPLILDAARSYFTLIHDFVDSVTQIKCKTTTPPVFSWNTRFTHVDGIVESSSNIIFEVVAAGAAYAVALSHNHAFAAAAAVCRTTHDLCVTRGPLTSIIDSVDAFYENPRTPLLWAPTLHSGLCSLFSNFSLLPLVKNVETEYDQLCLNFALSEYSHDMYDAIPYIRHTKELCAEDNACALFKLADLLSEIDADAARAAYTLAKKHPLRNERAILELDALFGNTASTKTIDIQFAKTPSDIGIHESNGVYVVTGICISKYYIPLVQRTSKG